MSPSTRSIASKPWRSASDPRRTRHRTTWPSARSAWITARPTNPVAPVTKTRCIAHVSYQGRRGRMLRSVRDFDVCAFGARRPRAAPPASRGRPRPALDFSAVDEAVQTVTAQRGSPRRRRPDRPGRRDPLPPRVRLAGARAATRADDARHDLRHRLAHQAAWHDARGDGASSSAAPSSSTRRSAAI